MKAWNIAYKGAIGVFQRICYIFMNCYSHSYVLSNPDTHMTENKLTRNSDKLYKQLVGFITPEAVPPA